MTIQEVLSKYDLNEVKGFYTRNVEESLLAVDEEEKKRPEFDYEMLAFGLQPQRGTNPWGDFYYGSKIVLADPNENPVYEPAFERITPVAILYWEKRYKESCNPLLKMRYAGLVWDYKKEIVKTNYDCDLYRILVDSIINVCNGDYEPHPTITITDLERLFELTKTHQEDLLLCKNAYCNFENRYNEDGAVRYWSSRFLMMLRHKKSFTEEEKDIILAEHETRLKRLCAPDENGVINLWSIEQQARLLADYYNGLQRKDEVRRVLSMVEYAFVYEKRRLTSLQFAGNLEMIQKLYYHYQLYEEAKRLLYDVQEATKESVKEMTPQHFEFDISKEVFQQIDVMFGENASSDEDRWTNFIIHFITSKAREEVSLKEFAQKYPFRFMLTTKLVDHKGRPTSIIGSIDSDFESNLTHYIAQNMKFDSYLLEMAIKEMIKTDAITTSKIMDNFIVPCPLFEEERYKIIIEALDLFFEGKYVLFSHLIVPQIENAICTLVELGGVSALKQQKNGKGFQLKTLDDLLREQPVVDTLTKDGAYYLRIVLTNQLGLNIRNLLCHGILSAEYFGYGVAGRLLHVLMMIGRVRFIEVD